MLLDFRRCTSFGRLFDRARAAPDPSDAYQELLGGYVYGFSTLGKAVVEASDRTRTRPPSSPPRPNG